MTYIRGKAGDYLARLQNQAAIAAAELEHKERELQAIRDAEAALARLHQKNRMAQNQLAEATAVKRLPPPIHGGRKGLLEAAKERADYEKRRRLAKA
jgi:hypothetical protein